MSVPGRFRISLGFIAWLIGVWYGSESRDWLVWWCIGSSLLAFLGIRRRSQLTILFLPWLLCWWVSGYSYTSSWRALHYHPPPGKGEYIGAITEDPDYNPDDQRLIVSLADGSRAQISTQPFPRFTAGDEIRFRTELAKPRSDPSFDYALFLERQFVHSTAKRVSVTKVGHRDIDSVFTKTRRLVESQVSQYLSEPEASFLSGIMIGSKQSISDQLQAELRTTGTSHIIAISGANITICLGLLIALLPVGGLRNQWLITCICALLLTVVSGASASVVRGAVIAVISQFIRMHGRPSHPTQMITLAMCLMLLANPLMLKIDPGFQLSFGAFAGLMYIAPILGRLMQKLPPFLAASMIETTAATFGTAPISYRTFGQVSFLGLLVNPTVLWLLPAITSLGFTLLVVSWWPWLAQLVAFPLWLLLHLALYFIHIFATL